MEFQKLIADRYSVRQFKPKHLKQEDIDSILSAACLAPTGCNYQPQRILVLNTEKDMQKLSSCTKCHFNAPAAMLVCYNKEESWTRKYDGALSAPVDAGIVATHIILAAHDLGIGACWVMHFDPFKMREEFNIPQNIEPLALIVMGIPDDDAKPLNLHYETRPIEDIVFYDEF